MNQDIKTFYDGPDFLVGNEPCLTQEIGLYQKMLSDIQRNCDKINDAVEENVRDTKYRLKSSKSLQNQVNRDIMEFVQKQMKKFDNVFVLGYEDN